MKLIVNYCGRYLASFMTGLALAVTGFAQSIDTPTAGSGGSVNMFEGRRASARLVVRARSNIHRPA
jgi:hypothetical protein